MLERDEDDDNSAQSTSTTSGDGTRRPVAVCEPFRVVDVVTMSHADTINAEQTITRLVSAARELVAVDRPDMTGKVGFMDPNTSHEQLYRDMMKNFQETIDPTLKYLNLLPAYSALPDQDRVFLFSRAVLPFVVCQLCLPPNNKNAFFGFNDHNKAIRMRLLPEYELLDSVLVEICDNFNIWNPTQWEVSLLMGLLFYQAEIADAVKNRVLIFNIIRRFKIVLHGQMARYDRDTQDRRLRHFMRAYDLIRTTPLIYQDIASQVFNRLHTKKNLNVNPLYMELYFKQHKDRSHMTRLLSSSRA